MLIYPISKKASENSIIKNFSGTRKLLTKFVKEYCEYNKIEFCDSIPKYKLRYQDVDCIRKHMIKEGCRDEDLDPILEDIFKEIIEKQEQLTPSSLLTLEYMLGKFHYWRNGRKDEKFIRYLVKTFQEMFVKLLNNIRTAFKDGTIKHAYQLNVSRTCEEIISDVLENYRERNLGM